MTLKLTVTKLFDDVASGKALEAFDAYYHDEVVMQENTGEPVAGKAVNRLREIEFLNSVKEWRSFDVRTITTDGDENAGVAIIEYAFAFVNQSDQPVEYQQVAVQRWRDGRIVSERFYYDTGS